MRFKETEVGIIPEEWEVLEIKEIGDVVGGGTPKTSVKEYWNGEIPWITPKDLSGYANRYIFKGERSITQMGFDNSSTKRLPKGAVLFSSRAPIGYLAIAGNDMCTNQGFKSIVCDDSRIFNIFLYYLMLIKRTDLENIAGGSTFKEVSGKTVKEFKIPVPPLNEQKAIAKILSSLDEKIELNNQINKTLEEIAQTIFKHWFIDFEFPNENGEPYKSSGGEMVESELGMIPKGWKVEVLKNLVKEVVTGKTPSTRKHEYYGDKYPFITIPDMHNKIFITETERYLSELGNEVQIKKLLPSNSILVSCIATVGLVAINVYESHTNQQINSIIPKYSEDLFFFYEYLNLMEDKLKAIGSTGSTTLNVNKGEFERLKFIYPNRETIAAFNDIARQNFAIIKYKQLENENLTQLRDTLLPKLMSGEIPVPLEKAE